MHLPETFKCYCISGIVRVLQRGWKEAQTPSATPLSVALVVLRDRLVGPSVVSAGGRSCFPKSCSSALFSWCLLLPFLYISQEGLLSFVSGNVHPSRGEVSSH